MILVDIGNTFLHFGVELSGKLLEVFTIKQSDFNKTFLEKLLGKYPKNEFLISSVVPSTTRIFKNTAPCVYIVGQDIKVPIKSSYNLNQVGQDRLINCFAVKKNFSLPRIIVDFGTATTIDFLSKRGVYLGGFILPGLTLYLQSLSQCALLPKNIKLIKTSHRIPKTTLESISKGAYEGFSFMIGGFIHKYSSSIFGNFSPSPLIITGGGFSLIKRFFPFKYIYEPLLSLKGLLLLKQTAGILEKT